MTAMPHNLRALLQRGNLTGSAAAEICGVNPRTVRRWIGGDSEIPYSAWMLIQQHVAATEFEADDDALEAAPPMPDDERLAVLRGIEQEQERALQRLEALVIDARNDLAETRQRIRELSH